MKEDQPITEQRREDSFFSISNKTKQRRKLHVFNCDHTYSLESVEDLLAATKAKLDFDPVVEKHYFALSQMFEMTTDIIPKLQLDMAFFVVNAQESRLWINEDIDGISYTKTYRALLEATGELLCGITFTGRLSFPILSQTLKTISQYLIQGKERFMYPRTSTTAPVNGPHGQLML